MFQRKNTCPAASTGRLNIKGGLLTLVVLATSLISVPAAPAIVIEGGTDIVIEGGTDIVIEGGTDIVLVPGSTVLAHKTVLERNKTLRLVTHDFERESF